jgi:Flp pilus assembly protein TadG
MRRHFSKRLGRLLRDTAGVNMIEAAIITPLMLLLSFSVVDFASIFYVYLALENGVSQATRYAVTGNTMTDPNNPAAQLDRIGSIKAAMRQATPTINVPDAAFSFSHMGTGAGGWSGGVGGPGELEKVTVTYTWNVMTPLLRPFFTNGQITFVVDSVMKNESRFQ